MPEAWPFATSAHHVIVPGTQVLSTTTAAMRWRASCWTNAATSPAGCPWLAGPFFSVGSAGKMTVPSSRSAVQSSTSRMPCLDVQHERVAQWRGESAGLGVEAVEQARKGDAVRVDDGDRMASAEKAAAPKSRR
jgi:hypothetical protein